MLELIELHSAFQPTLSTSHCLGNGRCSVGLCSLSSLCSCRSGLGCCISGCCHYLAHCPSCSRSLCATQSSLEIGSTYPSWTKTLLTDSILTALATPLDLPSLAAGALQQLPILKLKLALNYLVLCVNSTAQPSYV